MKTVILVGVLVFVACLCSEANTLDRAVEMPRSDGKIGNCKNVPASLKSSCVQYTCDDTESFSSVGCPLVQIRCEAGHIGVEGSEDMTKIYPHCCPKPSCKIIKQ